MLVPIRVIFLFAVICCAVGITKSSSADPDDKSLFNATDRTFGTDLASQSRDRLKQTVEASGKALSKSLDVINSVRTTGLDGAADILERGKTFISKTVPEHSTKFKNNLGETANALLNHGSNTISSLTKVASGVLKQADEVQGIATNKVNKIVEGVGNLGKSTIQNTGKVTGKVREMSQRALQTVGNAVTDPAKYASASVGYVRDTAGTAVSYIQDGAKTGVRYLKNGATTGVDYLKDGAKGINPITPLKKIASFLPTWSWS